MERFNKILALQREVRATTHHAVCSLTSMVLPPVIARDTALSVTSESNARDLLLRLLTQEIAQSVKKCYVSKQPKQLDSETVLLGDTDRFAECWTLTEGFTHLNSVWPDCDLRHEAKFYAEINTHLQPTQWGCLREKLRIPVNLDAAHSVWTLLFGWKYGNSDMNLNTFIEHHFNPETMEIY